MKNLLYSICALLISTNANAVAMSYTGNFANDDIRFYTTFDVTAASVVNLTSWGYAGGVNAAGDVIPDGGFDTQLFVFDSGGSLLFDDDDDSTVVSASSGNSWDALLSVNLAVGSYVAALTQYDSDYVSGDLFTGLWSGAGTTNFVDDDDNQRTSAYAFDISGDNITNIDGGDTNPVPEPATLALLSLGLVGLGLKRRKMKA